MRMIFGIPTSGVHKGWKQAVDLILQVQIPPKVQLYSASMERNPSRLNIDDVDDPAKGTSAIVLNALHKA